MKTPEQQMKDAAKSILKPYERPFFEQMAIERQRELDKRLGANLNVKEDCV